MTFEKDYLKLLGHIGIFTRNVTGTSVVDAYFGPENLSPDKIKEPLPSEKQLASLDALIGRSRDIRDDLKRATIADDLESLKVVVRWVSGEDIPFVQLVEGIFGITPPKFTQKDINKAQQDAKDACDTLSGRDVFEKIVKWEEKGKVSGDALRKIIDTEFVERTREIAALFEKRVFANFPTEVQNNGVIYKAVTDEPWAAYNYYQGNYTSINVFNVDNTFNKDRLFFALYHEYEHHVANLFEEKYYRENGALDLCALLLHTKRNIIGEGTANCAREFLELPIEGENAKLVQALTHLRNMIGLNVAYMLNVEGKDDETAAEYLSSEGFVPKEEARKNIRFSKPLTPDGKLNFFKPYIYTYFFGKKDYVLPTFQKARKKGKLKEFFQILYLNPYSRSTATWKTAFSHI